jgi:protein TonB
MLQWFRNILFCFMQHQAVYLLELTRLSRHTSWSPLKVDRPLEDASVPKLHDEKVHGEDLQSEDHSEIQLQRSNAGRGDLDLRRGGGALSAAADVEAQRKRMLIALAILLMALGAVIAKDWDFWFPVKPESAEAIALRKAKALAESPNPPAPLSREKKAAKAEETPASPFAAATERTALPPLEIQVVAGNRSVSVPGKNPAIHVDVGSGANSGGSVMAPPGIGSSTVHGGVEISRQAAQNVTVSVPPDYPLLARQMKVQGVVSLQALIARDGTIQELQILSGPEILATAAREAVRQWHFKPYLQNGQPVETQARITVNFTISTN